jgi:putative aldouronate transport system permease protein
LQKTTSSRKVFNVFNHLTFILLILLSIYPIWYIFITSVSLDSESAHFFLPGGFTLEHYAQVFRMEGVLPAILISVLRTLAGTGLTVLSCMLLGYLFSKPEMPFRKAMYRALIVTMYVSGGLIPSYLVMRAYGLQNNFLVYILPMAVSAYYVVLIKTFVEQLPAAVEESAKLDGAGTMTIFFRIILPMSLPIIATIAVYAAVAQWNSWFDNHIYTFTEKRLLTLQYLLYTYLKQAEVLAKQIATSPDASEHLVAALTPKSVRMTITMITVLPVLCIYPFLQRYFVKGIMIGAVKG